MLELFLISFVALHILCFKKWAKIVKCDIKY